MAAPAALALPAAAGRMPSVRWRGSALGAEAMLLIEQVDEGRAWRLIERVLAEIDRLESIFSLHRAGSSLDVLNRDGRLVAPPHELVDVLAEAGRLHRLTSGVFDPTVQPLWRLHAEHFSRPGADAAGPPHAALARARRAVGFERVAVEPGEIRLAAPGSALTLNGIAQGAITDRVADMLRNEGLEHVLIDLGEIRAIGGRTPGEPWRVDVRRPPYRDRIILRVRLRDSAIATSDPAGSVFGGGADGSHHHLIDPRTGRSSTHARPVTVLASRAMLADGLSTALAVMPPEAAARVAGLAGPDVTVSDTAA